MGTDLNDKKSAARLYRYIQQAQFGQPVWALGQVRISDKTVAGGSGVGQWRLAKVDHLVVLSWSPGRLTRADCNRLRGSAHL
jgi:hypothetical protein